MRSILRLSPFVNAQRPLFFILLLGAAGIYAFLMVGRAEAPNVPALPRRWRCQASRPLPYVRP
jgi:hypothetical protein